MIWILNLSYNTSLAEDIVITAAHCMDGAYIARMYLGAHNILRDEDTQVEVASHDFQIHENYDSNTLKNDIAYIRFPSPVTFSKKLFQTKILFEMKFTFTPLQIQTFNQFHCQLDWILIQASNGP